MAVVSSGQLTLTDLNDTKQMILYLNPNYRSQIYDPNTASYSPNFASTNLIIQPEVYIAGGSGTNLLPNGATPTANTQVKSVTWWAGTDTSTTAITDGASGTDYTIATGTASTTDKKLTVKTNFTSKNSQVFTCQVVYTDPDTNFDITLKASVEIVKVTNGQKGIDGTGTNAVMAVLTNDSAIVATDSSGTASTGNYGATATSIYVYEGATALQYDGTGTANGSFKVVATGTSITAGTITDGGVYASVGNASNMTADTGKVVYTITGKMSDGTAISLTKEQSFSKSKAGVNATSPTSYWVIPSVGAISKSQAGAYTPSTISASGMYQTGSGTPTAYSTWYRFSESTDGTNFTVKQTSTANATSASYAFSTAGLKAIKIEMFTAGGTTTLVDSQVVPIVADGIDGTNGINGINAITSFLTNSAVTLPASSAGVVSSFANSGTDIYVYDGATPLAYVASAPANGQFTVTATPTSVTIGAISAGTSPNRAVVANATALSADNGSVSFAISGKTSNGASISATIVQTFAKSKAGTNGTNGNDSSSYWLTTNYQVVSKSATNVISPTTVTATGNTQTGTGSVSNSTSFKWVVDTSTDGTTFTNNVASPTTGATAGSGTITSSMKAVRFRMYLSSVTPSTTNFLDEQVIRVVADGTNGTNGADGANAFYLNLWTPKGDAIRNSAGTIDLQADLYSGTSLATGSITYKWYIQDATATTASGGDTDGGAGWRLITSSNYATYGLSASPTSTTKTITIGQAGINGVTGWKAIAVLNSYVYSGVTVVRDFQDPISVNILGANIFKNGQGNVTLTAQLIQAGVEITDLTGYTFAWSLWGTDGTKIKDLVGTTSSITVLATDVTGVANVICDVSK